MTESKLEIEIHVTYRGTCEAIASDPIQGTKKFTS